LMRKSQRSCAGSRRLIDVDLFAAFFIGFIPPT
jgi:hypothetical protein